MNAGQTSETYKLAQALAEKEGSKTLDKLVKKAVANPSPRNVGRVRLEVEETLSAGRITAQEATQILAAIKQQNTAAETGSGEVKYQIRHTTDNRPVVEVTDNILEGVDKKDWQKTVKKAIKENFPDGIPISGRLIKVTGKTAGKYAYSKYTRRQAFESAQIYEDKLTAAGNLDEIVLASTNYINEDLNHERTDDITEFARGDVLMRVGGRDYSAKVVVGYTTSGEMLLYDVVDFEPTSLTMKKDGASQNRPSVETGYDRGDAPSTTSISDPVQIVKSMAKKFGVDAQTAELMVEEYDGKSDPVAYAQAFATAYTFARYNLPMDGNSAQVVRQTLSDTSMRHATQLGRLAAKVTAADAQKAVEARRAKLAKGGVDTADINTADLTARQRQSIGALDALGKALGVRFIMYDSQTSGKADSNGFYTTGTNEIYVDVRAGLDARGTILYTASHELMHFIEDWSPAKYQEFADFLMKELGKKKADVTAWVAQQKALLRRAGTELTGQELDDAAFSEVVAQACESFLAQPTVLESIERLAKQNQSLYSKIRSWLKRFYNKLRKARLHYDQSMLESAEGRAVAEMTDTVAELVELWSAGLVDAAANAQAAAMRTDGETVTAGVVKYSFKSTKNGLANDALVPYNGELAGIIRDGGNYIIDSAARLKEIVDLAFDQPSHKATAYFGIIRADTLDKIKNSVSNLPESIKETLFKSGKDYSVAVTLDSIRHIVDEKKLSREDVVDYLDRLADTIVDFDSVNFDYYTDSYKERVPGLLFKKRFADGTLISYNIVSHKKRSVVLQSLYLDSVSYQKKKSAKTLPMQNLGRTPVVRAGQTSNNSLSNSAENVKEKLSDRDTVGVRKNQIKADAYAHDTAGRRLTAEQQEFFKDSKVRDENGNLIALYHGTENGGFTVFDPAKADDGISLFFTDDIKVAETYSGTDDDVALPAAKPPTLRWTEGNTKRGKQQVGVYEVYLNLKNPLVIDCEGKTWGSIPFGGGTPVDLSYHIKHGEIVFSVKAKNRPTQTVRFADNANTEAEVRKFLTKTFNKEIGKQYSELFALVREDDADYGWKDSFERTVAFPFSWDFSNNTLIPTSTRGIAAWAKKEGYDGVIFRDLHDYGGHEVKGVSYASKKTTNIYVAFNKNAVKDVDNKTPTKDKDIRYQHKGESVRRILAEALDAPYSYRTLTAKPDMRIVQLSETVPESRKEIIAQAKKNAAEIGRTNEDGSVAVYVEDIGREVVLGNSGLKHGLDRRFSESAPVMLQAGAILKNSIRINELRPERKNADGSYVLIGAASSASGQLYIVRSVVNQFRNELVEMDVLYAINAKKESAALNAPRVSSPVTDSTISISDLLEYVNRYFPDVLSEDVLRYFGHTVRPAGELGKSAQFQPRTSSPRTTLAEALESTAANEQEQKLIRDYLEQADDLDAAEQELAQVNRQIRDMMFSKGERDASFYEKLGELHKRAGRLKNQIEWGDKRLLSLRSTAPIANLLDRERAAAAKRAKQAERAAYREQRENAQKTVLRDRLSRRVRHISSLLLRGNKQRNVKPELTGLTMQALESAAALFEESGENIGECMEVLERAYRELGNLNPNAADVPDAERARIQQSKELYKPEVADLLAEIRTEVDAKPVSRLDVATLEKVNRAFAALHHTLTESNKVFKNGKAEDVEKSAGRFIGGLKAQNKSRKETELEPLHTLERLSWANENPVTAIDRIGVEELSEMFWDLIAGQDTYARDMQDARDLIVHLRRKYGFNQWEQTKRTSFELKSGQTFSLNLQEMMAIYAYSKREQAYDHMTKGGFQFSDEAFSKHPLTGKWLHHNTAVTYQLTEEDIAAIRAALTKEQKGYVDEMQAYLSTTMGAKGNEVSRVLYGIDLFNERFYFPLQSSKQFLESTRAADSKQPSMVSLKNTGMTKEVVPGAGNPIVLRGFDVVCDEHIDKMSQYHGMVLPIENLQKVFNYTSYTADGSMISVRNQLTATHGDGAVTYLQQLLSDLNGGISQPGVKSPTLKMFAKFKKTAVGASLSTVVQQPTAIVRAMALIDPKYFAQKVTIDPEEAKRRFDSATVNADILSLIERVKKGDYRDDDRVNLGMVSTSVAKQITELTGVDVSGFSMAIEARQIRHILNRHGENGVADHSMANPVDIAKMEFAISDTAELSNAGKTKAYTQMKDGYNRTVDTVLYEKAIGEKSYYVVQAIPDTKAKTLYVVSTFIGPQGYKKSEASQSADTTKISSPGVTSKNATAETSIGSITKNAERVKTYEEIKRYAPIATVKEMGGFDTGSSAGAAAWLGAREYDTKGQKAGAVFTDEYYRDELWMKGAQKADELGWSVIWNAVKAEVADKRGRPVSVSKMTERREEVIDLSEDNELSKEIEGVFGSAKYKIIQRYILRLLGNQPVTMSDGVQAVVDKSDALHIANAAADKKTAQIAEVKNILSRAVPFAEDMHVEHAKFDYFRYYRVKVRYGAEVFDCYVNVGRGKNDGQYHLYDITKKIRDTADRINGLERPKPNEGYAQRNGISIDSISDSYGNVKFEHLRNTGDHYVINNMKAEDIRKVSKLIRQLNHAIKAMGKLYANGRFANAKALGVDTVKFLDALGKIQKTSKAGDWLTWDNGLPV